MEHVFYEIIKRYGIKEKYICCLFLSKKKYYYEKYDGGLTEIQYTQLNKLLFHENWYHKKFSITHDPYYFENVCHNEINYSFSFFKFLNKNTNICNEMIKLDYLKIHDRFYRSLISPKMSYDKRIYYDIKKYIKYIYPPSTGNENLYNAIITGSIKLYSRLLFHKKFNLS